MFEKHKSKTSFVWIYHFYIIFSLQKFSEFVIKKLPSHFCFTFPVLLIFVSFYYLNFYFYFLFFFFFFLKYNSTFFFFFFFWLLICVCWNNFILICSAQQSFKKFTFLYLSNSINKFYKRFFLMSFKAVVFW